MRKLQINHLDAPDSATRKGRNSLMVFPADRPALKELERGGAIRIRKRLAGDIDEELPTPIERLRALLRSQKLQLDERLY